MVAFITDGISAVDTSTQPQELEPTWGDDFVDEEADWTSESTTASVQEYLNGSNLHGVCIEVHADDVTGIPGLASAEDLWDISLIIWEDGVRECRARSVPTDLIDPLPYFHPEITRVIKSTGITARGKDVRLNDERLVAISEAIHAPYKEILQQSGSQEISPHVADMNCDLNQRAVDAVAVIEALGCRAIHSWTYNAFQA
jgi:hypothetical protein